MKIRTRTRTALMVATIAMVAAFASAEDSSEGSLGNHREKRFALRIGGTSVGFSTTVEYLQGADGDRIFISLEEDLGLNKHETVPQLDLLVRVGKKSYIAVDVNRFNRSTTLLDLDGSLDLGHLEIHAGADVDFKFNVTDFDISYGHAFYERDWVRIIGKFGLYVMDLDTGLRVEGDFSVGGVAATGIYEIDTSLLIPVPLVGVIFDFDVSRRWTFAASAELFYMPVSNITAEAFRARLHIRYAFSRTVGATFGYSHFDIEVIDDSDGNKTTIAYDMDGFYGGLSFLF
jgi:hypothetical protein